MNEINNDELLQLRKENESLRTKLNADIHKKQRKQESTKKTLNWTWKLFTGKSLSDNFNQWFKEYHSEVKVSANTSANLLTAIVRRFVRVRMLSLILLLFSLIPSLISVWVLIKQNSLINTQNALVEASRKSSYGFQLANIFDAVDKQGYTNSLKARIVGLSHSLKPYKQLIGEGELSETMYSPERSQLLLFLVNSSISTSNLNKIFESADFSHCDLHGMNFSGKHLVNVNLSNSNLEGANFSKANLSNATLINAILKNVKFSEGIAKKTNFKGADISNSDLRYADIRNANLTKSNLSNANVNFGLLNNTCFTNVIMENTNLNKANLNKAYYKGSFGLTVDKDSKAKGNLSEDYITTEYLIKEDEDGFDTFIKKQ